MYTPFESMERMLDQMRRDVTEWRENAFDWPGYGINANLSEREGEYVLTVDVPGFETEDIDLVVDDGLLVVSAVHESADETSTRGRSVSERIVLPKEVVAEEASATYRNGVLEVHLPIVAGATERGHRIDVE